MEWFSPQDLNALKLTLKVSIYATFFAFLLGIIFAWVLARFNFFGKNVVDAILTLPMVLPPTVLGYYLLVLFGRRGTFGPWLEKVFGLQLVFTWQGAVVAATVVAVPLVFKSARAAFEDVQKNLEYAARTLGSRGLGVFFRVSLPLAARGITAGVLLAFARAMGEFGATLMLAGNLPGRTQTLSMAVYDAVQAGDDFRANALVLLISVVCVTILAASGYWLAPKR
ncbi:molybdate ABC transporter permease subunit [Oligella sp. HMSC09E12]|uniref:molybdate ABC transporter permease subunit n=1 Tax=Oligella sp. HMSC09E12 TaxID=1581147 RepID=UPI0008A42C4C|nr:molybdate ABC transporter permease subunit [Oligella sp. HMSC09E12]OFV51436.1 molybdenum ABC transporter permease subunit [Oligella sp. HMSC09E12]